MCHRQQQNSIQIKLSSTVLQRNWENEVLKRRLNFATTLLMSSMGTIANVPIEDISRVKQPGVIQDAGYWVGNDRN